MHSILHTFEDRTEPVSKLFKPVGTADLLACDPGCEFDWMLPAEASDEGSWPQPVLLQQVAGLRTPR
jgi:hypothetical protein